MTRRKAVSNEMAFFFFHERRMCMEFQCDNNVAIQVSNKAKGLLYAYFRFLGDEGAKSFVVFAKSEAYGLRLYKKLVKIQDFIFDGFPKNLIDLATYYDSMLRKIEVKKVVQHHRRCRKEVCEGCQKGNPETEKK